MKTLQFFTILITIAIGNTAVAQNQSTNLYGRIDNYLNSGSQNGFAGAISVIKD